MRFLQLMRSLSIITLVGASAIVDCAKRAGPISTSSGLVVGAPITAAVTRYTVGYALPPTGSRRYKDPVRLTGIGPIDGTTTKPSCPQDGALTRSTTEDCLYLNVFAPITGSALPIMVWLHGGSRSANDPGLDGRVLAAKGVIVVVIEYRQGILGWLKQDSLGIKGNQGLKDIVMALQWVQTNALAFGGDKTKVTLAGQSTGGSLVRTLLATPSADTLFSKAILQSAPLDYGDQSEVTGNALGALYLEHINCNTMACLQTTSVDTILPAQAATVGGATSVGSDDFIPGVSQAEPFRPIVDGVLVRGNLLKWDTPLTRRDRVFMLTTVKDEAAAQISTVSQSFSGTGEPAPIDSSLYSYIVTYLLTPIARANAVLTSGLYDVDTSAADGTRDTLVQLGSDYVWTCPNQQAAVNASANTAARAIYLGQFKTGIHYPTNANIDLCEDGAVCHEDDILLTFGTNVGALSTQQKAVQAEWVARIVAFVKTGIPNAGSYKTWSPVKTATKLNMLLIGSNTVNSATATTASTVVQTFQAPSCQKLWGKKVPFDVQLY